MFKNYLKIALRNLKRSKVYSFINISGLAIGMTCCILILLYVQNELSYDRYHQNADRIFRVAEELNFGGKKSHFAITPAPFAPAMSKDFQEVLHAVRLLSTRNLGNKIIINHKNNSYYEDKWFYADSNLFEVFTFPLVKGNPKTALMEPFSLLITGETARRYFGDEDPMGKILTVTDKYHTYDFRITGVLKDVPQNSHFGFDFLASFSTIEKHYGFNLPNWFNHMYYTYLLLEKGCNTEELEKRFPEFIEKYTGAMGQRVLNPYLQSLISIHLHSHLEFEIETNSDIVYVYIFSAIAVFILLIACINFMNLATARSASRAREVGVRKVLGAFHGQLMKQFLGESILFAVIALLVAVVLVELFLPAFNTLAGKELSFSLIDKSLLILGLVSITLFVGIISGIYPALFLSAFRPVKVLKGILGAGLRSSWLRKGLIVFQFAVSIILIISTFVIMNQLNYIRTLKLGFQKEQVVVLPLRDKELRGRYEMIRNELLEDSRIVNVTASSGLPGRITYRWYIQTEGKRQEIRMDRQPPFTAWVLMVDHDFIKTLDIELVEGRDFSKSFATDAEEAVVLNESFVKALGWQSPLGKNIKTENKDGYVIGVVKDFHFQSLRQMIEPLVIYIYPDKFEYILARIAPDDIQNTLTSIKKKWGEVAPNRPFEYFFLDSDFDRFYRSEERIGRIFGGFSVLAIFVSCLGLFGLASFTAEQRTKEIGIRKVLGASVPNIVTLLTKEFAKWVVIANFFAWPVAYYAMSRWLQNFAYRVSVGLWLFLLSAIIAFMVALLTVSFQAVKAAFADPVESLRYE